MEIMNKPHDHDIIVPDPWIFLGYLATYMYSSVMESSVHQAYNHGT